MTDSKPTCLVCGQTGDTVPLLALTYQDRPYWICPSDLPVLIHKPAELTDRFPGAANLKPRDL